MKWFLPFLEPQGSSVVLGSTLSVRVEPLFLRERDGEQQEERVSMFMIQQGEKQSITHAPWKSE